MELTKELAIKLKKQIPAKGFICYGEINKRIYYKAVRTNSRYAGLPLYFYVTDEYIPVFVKNIYEVHEIDLKINLDEAYRVFWD